MNMFADFFPKTLFFFVGNCNDTIGVCDTLALLTVRAKANVRAQC